MRQNQGRWVCRGKADNGAGIALRQAKVDGIILAPSPDTEGRTLAYLSRSGMPAVLLDRLVDEHFDQVGVENRDSI